MAFLARAQDTKSPYRFSFITFNFGSENLLLHQDDDCLEIVHFIIYFPLILLALMQ